MTSDARAARPLSVVVPGEQVTVLDIAGGAGVRRRLTAMGLYPGSRVRMLQNAGRGPVLIMRGDARLALGRGMAHRVLVS